MADTPSDDVLRALGLALWEALSDDSVYTCLWPSPGALLTVDGEVPLPDDVAAAVSRAGLAQRSRP